MKHNKKNYKYDIGGIVNPMLEYGVTGTQLGLNLGGPLGAAIGGGTGLLTGAVLGSINQKRDLESKRLVEQQLLQEKKVNDTMRFNNLNDFESPYYMMYGGDIPQYDKGGIYIKPSKRGTFTKAAKERGMGVQEFASKVLSNKEDYSTAVVKKANFAKNASKWKHEMGGIQPNAEVEHKEVIQLPYMYPMYAEGGYMNSLSSNGFEAVGNTHSEGGIDTQLPEGTRIFSDKLKLSNGKSYAEVAKKLEKDKGNAEKKGLLGKNTAKRINKQLDTLFQEQESSKVIPSKGVYQYGGPVELTKAPNYWGLEDALSTMDPNIGIENPQVLQSKLPRLSINKGNTSIPPIGNSTMVSKDKGESSTLDMIGSTLPYISPLLQGLSTYGEREYVPQRRIDESIASMLPGDREAELMTRSGISRNREGLFTALKGAQSLSSPAYGAVASSLFSNYLNSTGDLASQEAQLKANLKSNKVNTLLGIRSNNLNQARLEDENRLMTNANTRNIRRQAFGDISKIAQSQGYEDLLRDRDKLALAATLAKGDPQVRANYLKGLKIPKSYQYLFE